MSIKNFSVLTDVACVQRDKDKLVCFPRNYANGVRLSDDSMCALLYVYSNLVEEEMKARKKNERSLS